MCFLHAQAAFLPARPKPCWPWTRAASLITSESDTQLFPRKQAIHARNQSIHRIPPELLNFACRFSHSYTSHSESISCYSNSSGSFPSSQAQLSSMFATLRSDGLSPPCGASSNTLIVYSVVAEPPVFP